MTYVIYGFAVFSLSYIGVALIRIWALRQHLLDIPNARSSHTIPTPRGGGLAIAVILLVGFSLTGLGLELKSELLGGYLLGGVMIAVIGGLDDIMKLSARLRLFVQLLVALVFVTFVGWFSAITLPWFGQIDLGWLGIPFTLFWIVGLVNIYNFMDGIDGIAAGQAIVAGTFWLVVLLAWNVQSLVILVVLLIGACLGFLLHNLPPARIFMGDAGSTLLGYTFAVLPILVYRQTTDAHFFVFGVLCIAPFVFDGALTIIRRALKKENVLQAHRSHLYQRLTALYSHGAVSLLYASLALVSGFVALLYLKADDWIAGSALLGEMVLLVGYSLWVNVQEHRLHYRFPMTWSKNG